MSFRPNNIFELLGDTEGDPVAVVKEVPKKEPTPKQTTQRQPIGSQKQAPVGSQKQNQPAGSQKQSQPAQKKPENQKQDNKSQQKTAPKDNKGTQNKGADNKTNETKRAPPKVDAGDTADLIVEKPQHTRSKGYESIKRDRKSRTGYDTSVKKEGEGRYNWGKEGTEYRPPRRGRKDRDDFSKEDTSVATEGTETTKEDTDNTTQTEDAKEPPKEPPKKSLDEYLQEQEKLKKVGPPPKAGRKAGEGEENKWTEFVPLKKDDEVYIQAEDKKKQKEQKEKEKKKKEKENVEEKDFQVKINLPRRQRDDNRNPKRDFKSNRRSQTTFDAATENFPELVDKKSSEQPKK